MIEKIINIDTYNPVDIFGVNDSILNIIKNNFIKLKIIARGNNIKIIGDEYQVLNFEKKFALLLTHFDKFGKITENDINQIMGDEDFDTENIKSGNGDVLIHGRNGKIIKPITSNQYKLVNSCKKNDLVFAIGPAGTGKTYIAVALAVKALKNKEVKRIILTRPAVEAGENLGFLPGDMRDKLDPYLQPLYDALRDMLPTQKLLTYLEDGTIEIIPLAYMRGRTLDNAFVILDEAQNSTISQIKMFLTRMGKFAKFVVTGDITQIDLPGNQASGLIHAQGILDNISGIDFIYLNKNDIIRHKLVTKIINAYRKDKIK
ncbi:MAG: PhoH family protein [Bacteroidales bacterium]|nr:PhoH family protein [Bacteroidales bacterium]